MTLAEFNSLSISNQEDIIWEWGYYVCSKQYNDFTVALFLFGDFFSEVYISTLTNKTENIKGVDKNGLNPDFIPFLNKEDPLIKAILHGETKPNNPGSISQISVQ